MSVSIYINNDDRSGCAPPFQKSRSAPAMYVGSVNLSLEVSAELISDHVVLLNFS